MPIKSENRGLYPPDWPFVRKRILERDKYHCCGCGLRDHSVGYRDVKGNFIACSGNVTMEDFGQGINPSTGNPLSFKRALEIAAFQNDSDEMGNKYIVIVLTIAHLDHTPENCSDDNRKSVV